MWTNITNNTGLMMIAIVVTLTVLVLLGLLTWQFSWFGKLGRLIGRAFGATATGIKVAARWAWNKMPRLPRFRRPGWFRFPRKPAWLSWTNAKRPFVWILKKLTKRSRKQSWFTRQRKKYDRWRENTKRQPWSMGPVTSAVITVTLAFLTGFIPIGLTMLTFSWFGAISFWSWENFGFMTTGSLLAVILLTFEPNGKKLRYVDVPENHGAIPTWLGRRWWLFYYTEGNQMIPYWLGFWYSEAPIAKTVFYPGNAGEKDGEKSMKDLAVDLGHFTEHEKNGFVFLGDRLLEVHVLVQARELSRVAAAANENFYVRSPYLWQRASNPQGTVLGRLAAGLRMGIAENNSEDANQMPSWLPYALLGGKVLVARVAEAKGEFIRGDIARTPIAERVFWKRKAVGKKTKEAFLTEVNDMAHADAKPQGGFTEAYLDVIDIGGGLAHELDRFGAVNESISVEDITLPEAVENAGAQLAQERAQRRAELFEADTRVAVTARIAEGINSPEKQLSYEYALIEGGKGKLLRGTGSNIAAQVAGLIKGDA